MGPHLGPESAALRVWTIKEAVAKALDMSLPETWQASEVLEIGEKESRVQVKKYDSNRVSRKNRRVYGDSFFSLIFYNMKKLFCKKNLTNSNL